MPSPFPGMDPFLETNPIFQELHTQILAEMQALLQPQLRPKYVARLERHLSEGSVWDAPPGAISLERKEPDVTIASRSSSRKHSGSTAVLAQPAVSVGEELDADELELRKQRRIVIYVQDRPRLAVTGIELLSPGNKQPGAVAQERYLEKRASALHGGLHWVEIDLLRDGARPPIPVTLPENADYLSYVAQATPTGWNHLVYAWALRDPLPVLPIPLLGEDRAELDLGACFASAYDRIAADDEVDYAGQPLPPPVRKSDVRWMDQLLRAGPSREKAARWTAELTEAFPSREIAVGYLQTVLTRGDRTMSITIEMTSQEIAALKQANKLDNDADAVLQAAREFLRLSRLRELKAVSGKVEFDANWQQLEELELAESGFPQ